MKIRSLFFPVASFSAALLALSSCNHRLYKTSVVPTNEYHSPYDDTTLTVDNTSVLMPYNRFIDPAGTVMRFGKASIENHSLDCVLSPDNNTLIVEDRYGLAFIDVANNKLLYHLDYTNEAAYKNLMSTYSGLKVWETKQGLQIFWGAANPTDKTSFVMEALWDGKKASIQTAIPFKAVAPAPMSLPNDLALRSEGNQTFLYVVLNGNSQLVKLNLADKKIVWSANTGMAPFGLALTDTKAYVSNWAGAVPTDASRETAGIPYAKVYVNPKTGATSSGTVSVIDLTTGKVESEIEVGLHPNSIITSRNGRFVYVSNGNSDNVSVINTASNKVVSTLSVKLNEDAPFIGHSPNALALSPDGHTLYVSNGMDNAIAVIKLSDGSAKSADIEGFIPTEAYPAGLVATNNTLYIANLEGEGARASNNKTYGSHQQEATVSIVPVPDKKTLKDYTTRVEKSNLLFRAKLSRQAPRKGIAPTTVPERIGEPSVFKHVLYIIKENKTYDQVMGDATEGNGMKSLCIYGDNVTPNQHLLAKQFLLLDNYYVAGKSSAEGHSWTDAAIVTDYVEKNVRAWFRSYPHVLADALVYNNAGFLWNNALDHGKTVRIYGEACSPKLKDGLGWKEVYDLYKAGKAVPFTNESTLSRVTPVMSPSFPCYEGQTFNDQLRADAFIKELRDYEKMPGDALPQLMVMALPADHTAGLREGFPTPRAMVADNDLALGRILEALTKSRFWDSTVVFVTEDDSQSGWDHVSAYRTTGFVISPYSRLQKTVHTNYNQTCMVRTIEQILGLPPMNVVDATALLMFECFGGTFNKAPYSFVKNNVSLTEMNKAAGTLSGKAKRYTLLSNSPELARIDSGNDDLLNRILWFDAMGTKPYPQKMTLPKNQREKDND